MDREAEGHGFTYPEFRYINGTPAEMHDVLTRLGFARVRNPEIIDHANLFLWRAVPAELNPLAQSGRAANLALLAAVVSGVLMLLWYSPSVPFASPSLAALAGPTQPQQWTGTIHAEPGRLNVLTFEPGAGFRLE